MSSFCIIITNLTENIFAIAMIPIAMTNVNVDGSYEYALTASATD